MNHNGLNQLLCAAVINNRFREALLSNPAQAVAAGYCGHTFSLTNEERNMVAGIKARHLEDFAAQVHAWLSCCTETPVASHGTGSNGKQQPREAAHRRNGGNGRNGHLPIPLDLHQALGVGAFPAGVELHRTPVLT